MMGRLDREQLESEELARAERVFEHAPGGDRRMYQRFIRLETAVGVVFVNPAHVVEVIADQPSPDCTVCTLNEGHTVLESAEAVVEKLRWGE